MSDGRGRNDSYQLNQHDDDNKGNVMQQNWTVNRARGKVHGKQKRTQSIQHLEKGLVDAFPL